MTHAYPKPGDKVRIKGGRYHGARGVLRQVGPVDTPAGFKAQLAVVTRPRAGDTVVFAHEVVADQDDQP